MYDKETEFSYRIRSVAKQRVVREALRFALERGLWSPEPELENIVRLELVHLHGLMERRTKVQIDRLKAKL